jgi:hypothetical protein
MKQPVLIVVDGGIPEVQYCPPGIVVLIKDYDVECLPEECGRPELHDNDPCNGDHFSLSIATHGDSRDKGAKAEGIRLMRKEGMR